MSLKIPKLSKIGGGCSFLGARKFGSGGHAGVCGLLFFLSMFLLAPQQGRAQLNTNGVIAIGRTALYYEDYVLSIQYFNQVIEVKPYLYEPYYYRAVAKYYLGDYLGAVQDCNLSIERDPYIDDCFKLRAISLIMNGEFEKAVDDYHTLLSRRRDEKETWYNLVLCETQLREFEKADMLLDTMITKWPTYANCYLLKAQIALERKDTVSAGELIDKTLQLAPFDVDALSGKAMLYMQTGDYAQAEEYYDRAIIQSPRQAGFYINRALARYHLNNLRGAMDDYSIALDIEPDNYLGHYNRGLLRMQVGESNLAIEDFDFVLKTNPRDRLALFNRAILREETGDYKGAIEDYTTVLEDYPEFTTGYENRARCRRKVGDERGALSDERKVFKMQLDEMYGSKKNQANRQTRKQSEEDIDDYEKLVVNNDDESIVKFYSSDYRGRIQNRDVAIEPQPLFSLTFSRAGQELSSRNHYENFLGKIEEEGLFGQPLYLSVREPALEASDVKAHDAEAAKIFDRLTEDGANSRLLFAHALYAAEKRDYAAAMADLNQSISIDSTNIAALFLRATVSQKQVETGRLRSGTDVPTVTALEQQRLDYATIVSDFSRILALDSEVAIVYYNRACIYAQMKNFAAALADYNRAIELNDVLAEAYYNRGLLHIENGNYADGFVDLGKAGELGLYSAYSLIKHFRKEQQDKKAQR